MNEKMFYDELWELKSKGGRSKPRDIFHKLIIDRIFDPFDKDRIDVAAKMLNPGDRILDLGIWGGRFLTLPEIKTKFASQYGMDISQESVIKARENGIANVFEWNLNNIPYPFEHNYFDAVALLAVLEHLFNPEVVVAEIYRLLKPGGQFVLALPNIASLSNRARLLMGILPVTSLDPGWDGGHLHYFTIQAAKTLLTENGFRIKKTGISGGGQFVRLLWPSLLAGEFIICAEKI